MSAAAIASRSFRDANDIEQGIRCTLQWLSERPDPFEEINEEAAVAFPKN